MHPLDRPVWGSLAGPHAALALGGTRARRYAVDVNVFAAAEDESPPALAELVELMQPGDRVYLLQAPEIVVPEGVAVIKRARGVQMVATRRLDDDSAPSALQPLADADAGDMLQLALLTEPGPFLARTHTMGRFVGVREGGQLVAMAGERFCPPGYREVSGVCTHPHWRGRGLARRASTVVAAAIQERGETPFLHAWATNHAAIALYRSLGFAVRCEVDVAVLERSAPPSTFAFDEATAGRH